MRLTKMLPVLIFAAVLGSSLTNAQSQQPVTKPESQVDSVIQLVNAGLSDDLIIQHLRQKGTSAEISPADMVKMQKAHVPDTVVAFMLNPAGAPSAVPPTPPAQAAMDPIPPPPPVTDSQPDASSAGPPSAPPSASSPVAAPKERSFPAGTEIIVRTIDPIDSKKNGSNKEYTASLSGPLMLDGDIVIPARALVYLKIAEVKQAGAFAGRASLMLKIVAVTVNGQRVSLETNEAVSRSAAKGKDTAIRAGGGAAGGAALGAMVGGGIGAGIGAGVGAAAGLGSEFFNHKTVKIAPETLLTFKLAKSLVVGP